MFHDLTADVNNHLSTWNWASNTICRIASNDLLTVNRNRLAFRPSTFKVLWEMAMNRLAIEVVGDRQHLLPYRF